MANTLNNTSNDFRKDPGYPEYANNTEREAQRYRDMTRGGKRRVAAAIASTFLFVLALVLIYYFL